MSDMDKMVILSLGSNIEPRREWIEKAVGALALVAGVRDVRCSPLYETVPDGVPVAFREMPFLNGVVTLVTGMEPLALLEATQAVEARLGRVRDGVYGSPRTIDIDIVAFGDVCVNTPTLVIPHPRAVTRRFVLQPLADLLPDYRFPGQTLTVSEILARM